MSEPNTNPHPYDTLTPDVVLDAIESVGLRADGRLLTLNSYENRVYQVWLELPDDAVSTSVIAKFYRPQRWSEVAILEEHAFTSELVAQEIPVVAPLCFSGHTLHRFADFHFSISPRIAGRAPDLEQRDTLEWIGRFLGRIHLVGASRVFAHRVTLSPEIASAARGYVLQHHFVPTALQPAYEAVTTQALDSIAHAFSRAGDVATIRLHGDCHAGNVLWNDGPQFVDFDDCCNGPALQDLWMLLSGSREEQQTQLLDVLAGYEDFMPFDRRELHLLEALRTLRLLHMSAWIARRWDDPAFPRAFPWFGSERYWQDRILELREQIALMHEPPLYV